MSYDINDPIQNKSMWILEESVVGSGNSFDKLKGELQVLWLTHEDPDNVPSLYLTSPNMAVDSSLRTITVADLPRDMINLRLRAPDSYIYHAEFNPTKVSRISDSLAIPNYQIPLRLYGDPEKIFSDSQWEAILMGENFRGVTYPRLIDMNSLFYDTALQLPLPYSIADINSSYGAGGYPADVTNRIQVTNEYNHYSPAVKRYQDQIGTYASETLIPSTYLFETIYCAPHVASEEGTPETYAALQAQLGTASMNRVTLVAAGTEFPLVIASANTHALQAVSITGSGAHYLHEWLDRMSYLDISSSDKDEIMNKNKNLLFTSEFYEFRDALIGTHGENIAREFPYYNKIVFQRHKGTDTLVAAIEHMVATTDETLGSSALMREIFCTGLGNTIAKTIQEYNASSIFLESLKNLVLGEFNDFKMTEKAYHTYTREEKFEGAHSTFRRYLDGVAKSQTYRQVDFPSFLTYIQNNLTEAISNDTTTLGPVTYTRGASAAWESHESSTSAARYANAAPIQNVTMGLIPFVQWSGLLGAYELAQNSYSAELAEGESTGMVALQQSLYNAFFIQNSVGNYKEIIAYRIEKIGGSVTQDQTTATPIQNFWIFNSTHAPDELEFYDSQVKYGEEYTYNIHAYVITLSQRYKYTDFAVSIMEQEVPATTDEAGAVIDSERYYLSFFDPLTSQRTSQTFFDGRGRSQEFAINRIISLISGDDLLSQSSFSSFLNAWFSAEEGVLEDAMSPEYETLFDNSMWSYGIQSTIGRDNHTEGLPTQLTAFRERLIYYVHQHVGGSYNYSADTRMALFLELIEHDTWLEHSEYHPWSPTPISSDELLTIAEDLGINDSALARVNEIASSEYELSESRYLADCRVLIEPCIKLIEIPLYSKTLRLYDNPANGLTINPFQYVDQSNKVGYDIGYNGFKVDMVYPDVISEEDMTVKANYLHAKDYITENIKESLSPQRHVEVYRIDHKPAKYSEFATGLVATIDLKIPNSKYCQVKTLFTNKVEANKKYYFLFRFVNELGMPGHLSQILETELINDGGYIYAKFGTLAEAEMEVDDHIEVMSPFKKIIQITPSMAQLKLDDSNVDYTMAAAQGLNDLTIGINATAETSDSIWGDTFKIRLVSKKTGKKIDLNITYALTDEDVYTDISTAPPPGAMGTAPGSSGDPDSY